MIYFTSDLYLGHANIIKHCNRPFEDVSKMDDALIDNWNMRVHRDDTIYIVGDLMFRVKSPENCLERLKGKKHLVVGNHDKQWIKRIDIGNTLFLLFPFRKSATENTKSRCVIIQ
jgi:calcineurin-like phosphoesterase family protein